MERVIITGADGFVGSYTVNCFLEQGKEVLALDIVDKPNRLTAHEMLTYKKLDPFLKRNYTFFLFGNFKIIQNIKINIIFRNTMLFHSVFCFVKIFQIVKNNMRINAVTFVIFK